MLTIWILLLPQTVLLTISESRHYNANQMAPDHKSYFSIMIIFFIAIISAIVLGLVFEFLKLCDKRVTLETKHRVYFNCFCIARRIITPLLVIWQDVLSNFEFTFLLFTINSFFACTHLKWKPYSLRIDHLIYFSCEIAMLIYNFIMVSFTSYNLDIFHKNKVGYVGVSMVMLFFNVAVGLRIYEIITNYKKRRAEMLNSRRNTTQNNLVNENDLYNSEVQSEQMNEQRAEKLQRASRKVAIKPRIQVRARTDRNKKTKEMDFANFEEGFKENEEMKF